MHSPRASPDERATEQPVSRFPAREFGESSELRFGESVCRVVLSERSDETWGRDPSESTNQIASFGIQKNS